MPEMSGVVWTCMSCGAIVENRLCSPCGSEAMPGRWVAADALRKVCDEAVRYYGAGPTADFIVKRLMPLALGVGS
jgi:hypothetical protein